jgi:hypothetical protein
MYNMVRGSLWEYAVPVGRTLAGFIFALLLAFLGDLGARILNLILGYPWSLEVYQNINIASIGAGAGIGAYLGWINWGLNRYWMLGTLLPVIGGGVLGAYLGLAYGPGVDPTYWWSRFATDTTIYLTAAIGGTICATAIGLVIMISSAARLKSRHRTSAPDRSKWRDHEPTI